MHCSITQLVSKVSICSRRSIDNQLAELYVLLEAYLKRGQTRDKREKELKFLWQFTIGRTVRALTTESGNPTWSYKHNFRDKIGVYSLNAKTLADPMRAKTKSLKMKAIYAKAGEILAVIDPTYAVNGDWVLQVHAMDSTSRVDRHTDDDDISYQYGVVLGDFDGGEMLTWGSDGQPRPVLNVQNKIVKLDGRLPHQVTPVTRGVRYACYFYKLFDRRMYAPAPVFEPARIVHERSVTAPLQHGRAFSSDEDGDGPTYTNEHVQCTFHVEGQQVGAVFDLSAALTAVQVAEAMTAAAQEMFGDGRAIGLQVAGRPFLGGKVLGQFARNPEATYKITAVWRCPRALLQALTHMEAGKTPRSLSGKVVDWKDHYIWTPLSKVVELIMANPLCQPEWEEVLSVHGADRRALRERMPIVARQVLARVVGEREVDRFERSAVYEQLLTGGALYKPGETYPQTNTGFERAIQLGQLKQQRDIQLSQLQEERAKHGSVSQLQEQSLSDTDRLIRVCFGKLDRRVIHGLRVEPAMDLLRMRHFRDDDHMLTDIATALLGRLPLQCGLNVDTLKASERLQVARWRAEYGAMSEERLRMEPNRWGSQQLPLDTPPTATKDELVQMHVAKKVFEIMDMESNRYLEDRIDRFARNKLRREIEELQERVTRQTSSTFDLYRAIDQPGSKPWGEFPVHSYARVAMLLKCPMDDALVHSLRARLEQHKTPPIDDVCRGKYRGTQCELSEIIFTKQRLFPQWFQCKNKFKWQDALAVECLCPGCPLSEYSLTDPDVAKHIQETAPEQYSSSLCTCPDYASGLQMDYTAHHQRMCELNYMQYLLLDHHKVSDYLEKALVAPSFWSRKERVAFQIKGMHAYMTSKDASVLNATIKRLTQDRAFIFKTIEQWLALTLSYDTGAVSHDAFQNFLCGCVVDGYDSLLEKVPPAAIPGAAAAPSPLYGKYGGSHCEVCEISFQGNADRKREQRQFYFFRVMLDSCSDREEHLETRRVKNKGQTVGEATYALSGLTEALKKPPQTEAIEATIEAVNGPMSWAAFLERDTQVRCGVCCPDCWYRFCVKH
jgi:hypothetical protein